MPISLKHCFLLLFLLPALALSQSQRVDSLKQVFYNQYLSASEKGLLAFKIAEQFRNTRYLDSALHYADTGLEFSEKAGEDNRMMYYYLAGQVHFLSGSYLLASRFFETGLRLAEKSKDEKYLGFLSTSSGISYATSGKYKEALESFYIALSLFEDLGKRKQAISTKLNIANLYGKLEQQEKALELLDEIYEESIEASYARLGVRALLAQAEHYESLRQFSNALAALETALAIANEKNYIERVSCYESLGRVYSKLKRHEEAHLHLQKGLFLAREIKRKPLMTSLITSLGDAQWEEQGYVKAINYYFEALELTDSTNLSARMELCKKLARCHNNINQMIPAYFYSIEATRLTEQIYAKESAQRIAEMEAHFAFDQKMQRLKELEAAEHYNQIRFWAITLVLLCTLVALIFAIRFSRIKQSVNHQLNSQNQKIKIQNTLLEEQSVSMKEQNIELVQTNQDLEYFAYAASHDLKEPLRTIFSYLGLIKRKLKKEKETLELVDFAMDGATRMENLLSDLLTYARIGRKGKTELIDTNSLLDGICAGLDTSIQEKGAVITYKNLPAIMGKRPELHLLFQNLLSNGIKFHREDIPPEITITGKRKKNFVEIKVKDNGIGINPRYQEKVFAAFQRLHSHDKYQGTGIGLALVKKIVNMHQGEISIESQPDQQPGTTFTIKFFD